tara:strand:+ start:5153 stop:6265 length:1113 start_codon:yes stop_codon:yes gene_type:complete
MINTYIPYLKGKEKKLISHCFKTNFVSSSGELISKFEEKFCRKYKFKYASALNSGTSALHIGLKSIGVSTDDIVIVPSYTFAATVNAILYNNAKPWFFDCNNNFELSLSSVEKIIKKNTYIKKSKLIMKSNNKIIKAIIPVSTFGKKLDFNKYYNFAKKYKLKILFDTAACHDPKIFQFKKKDNMNFIFSFNGNKTITTGAGGIFASNSKSTVDKVRTYANVGKKLSNYDYSLAGFNYKMTNIQAALGIAQIDNLNRILKLKRRIFSNYSTFFNKSNFQTFKDDKYTNWVFVIVLKDKNEFKILKKKFNKLNIQLDYFWKPLHKQKPYQHFLKNNLKFTNNIWNRVATLPSHPGISKGDQNKIFKIIGNL